MDVDFHSDETMDPTSETLRLIAEAVLDVGWDKPVTVGHCCSLSTQDEKRALETLDLVAKAGLNIVSLPMCNLYLQDRTRGRTPRNRGITLVHEMVDRGINVSFASDNTRDPFYAYGDLDMLEVMRQATRIGHLDHSRNDWPNAFLTNPAKACGFKRPRSNPARPPISSSSRPATGPSFSPVRKPTAWSSGQAKKSTPHSPIIPNSII